MTTKQITPEKIESLFMDLYKHSTPSLDLDAVTGPIKPSDHRITIAMQEKILAEHELKLSDVMFVLLNKGPKLVKTESELKGD